MSEKLFFSYIGHDGDTLFAQSIERIETHIDDETSRMIFRNRLWFSLTLDFQYIRRIIDLTLFGQRINSLLESKENLYIYGAGLRGLRFFKIYRDIHWRGFIDKNKDGILDGQPILPLDGFIGGSETCIIISNLNGEHEIRKALIDQNVRPEQIYSTINWDNEAAKEQYFENRCLQGIKSYSGGFVDLGAYDGSDSIHFATWCGESQKKLFVFEPEPDNFARSQKHLQGVNADVTLFPYAVSDSNHTIEMTGDGAVFTVAEEEKKTNQIKRVKTVSLDSVLREQKIGFIKMDIEGSEVEALKGAAEIIREQHPVLAISVYHCRQDIWMIPQMILDIYDGYLFRFGHYSLTVNDTVLYAVPQTGMGVH